MSSTAEYMREWRKKNPEKSRAISKRWYATHTVEARKANKEWKRNHPKRVRELNQKSVSKARDEALAAYGNKCVCCNEARKQFLTIDHIDGNGAEHRRKLGTARIEAWLKQNNWPKGFRVLCMNCNWALGKYGYCHEGGIG